MSLTYNHVHSATPSIRSRCTNACMLGRRSWFDIWNLLWLMTPSIRSCCAFECMPDRRLLVICKLNWIESYIHSATPSIRSCQAAGRWLFVKYSCGWRCWVYGSAVPPVVGHLLLSFRTNVALSHKSKDKIYFVRSIQNCQVNIKCISFKKCLSRGVRNIATVYGAQTKTTLM